MRQEFQDKFQMTCIFNEEGVIFSNAARDVYFPYGCLDSLNMSFLGVIQAVSRGQVCCFTAGKADKAELKEWIRKAKEAMKTAPAADPILLDLSKIQVDAGLPAEEQLKQYKAHYVQGMLSRDQFNLKKKLLTR